MRSRARNKADFRDPKPPGMYLHRERRFHYHPLALGCGSFFCEESPPTAPELANAKSEETIPEPAGLSEEEQARPAWRMAAPNVVEKMLIAEHGILHHAGGSRACPKCQEQGPQASGAETPDTGTFILMVLLLLLLLHMFFVYVVWSLSQPQRSPTAPLQSKVPTVIRLASQIASS